ncbi:CG-1 domain-domain-containing protein [Ostreococcus tauri]|uniref:CG-1 domain-domain-containing protein n=1 Tax=Ostreococcus tauri TaxID=70448 RepID=A0A1Y5I4S6_OSTTA|nr:CG-1 domain-domain-containing protein [Ostreococcus tauri]
MGDRTKSGRGSRPTATATTVTGETARGGAMALREPGSVGGEASMRQRAVETLKHARARWLRNTEVCDVLLNYNAYGFECANDAPVRPSAGTLYLINRKTVRFFRKDGHNWQKKKDGKTVRETHEKLKVGTVELLNCYYTHCEDDPKFQRRCYWLLNMDEGAVLVHYLRVKTAPTRPLLSKPAEGGALGKHVVGSKKAIAAIKEKRKVKESGKLKKFLRNVVQDDESRQNMSEMLERDDADLAQIFGEAGLLGDDARGDWYDEFDDDVKDDLTDAPVASFSQLMRELENSVGTFPEDDFAEFSTLDSAEDDSVQDFQYDTLSPAHDTPPSGVTSRLTLEEFERRIEKIRSQWQDQFSGDRDSTSMERIERQINALENEFDRALQYSLKQRADSVDAPTDTGSGEGANKVLGSRDEGSADKEPVRSSDAAHSDNQRQASSSRVPLQIPATLSGVHVLWSIIDFTPSWDDISGGAKVIITGEPRVEFDSAMCCVFGTTSVRTEWIAPNVLRCEAPPHSPGVVSMFLAMENGNGHPVSEISSFEYIDSAHDQRGKRQGAKTNVKEEADMSDRNFQIRLVHLLTTLRSGSPDSPTDSGAKSVSALDDRVNTFDSVSRSTMELNTLSALRAAQSMDLDPYNLEGVGNEDLMKLLTNMLQARLKSVIVHENRRMKARLALPKIANAVSQVEEVAKTDPGLVREEVVEQTQDVTDALMTVALAPSAYARKDEHGLTIFHCCAALGIEWAVRAMCATGVDINHTDVSKRTALHWAVARGHEMVVATLLNSGAKSRVICEWDGKRLTPAELAIHCGHEGIAAYISEANLASALDLMNLRTKGVSKATETCKLPMRKLHITHVRPTTLDDESDGSDSEDAGRVLVTSRPRHRRKVSKAAIMDEENDHSETEAAFIVKRAERARQNLIATIRDIKVNSPEYVNAALHAQIGKRRGRQLRQGDVKELMSELLTRNEDDGSSGTNLSTRRPAMRARRMRDANTTSTAKITVCLPPVEEGETSSDDDEEAIDKNVVRIKSTLKSAAARSQYLRLRRATTQLRRDLQAEANYSDSDDHRSPPRTIIKM